VGALALKERGKSGDQRCPQEERSTVENDGGEEGVTDHRLETTFLGEEGGED